MSKITDWEKNNNCFVYLQFLAYDTSPNSGHLEQCLFTNTSKSHSYHYKIWHLL